MDAQMYATVVQSICNRVGITEPNDTIIRNVTAHCRRLNIRKLKSLHNNQNDFLLAIVNSYMESIKAIPEFDGNEYLKNSKKSIDNMVSTTWLQSNIPIEVSKTMSIYFNTMHRNAYNDGTSITNFGFTLIPRSIHASGVDGNIQSRVLPSQITYFKIGSFTLPYTNDMSVNNFTKEITLTFTALTSNGILSNEQTYHFIFSYTVINNSLIQVTPINKYCKFCPPLRHLDDLTLHFSDPLIPIAFDIDRMVALSLNYTSVDGRITFASAHGLTTGDIVIIQSFHTLDDTSNTAIINQIQNPRGFVITVINPTTIAIGIDFTTIISPDVSYLPMVLFYSKTFRFPLEIGYQDISELN